MFLTTSGALGGAETSLLTLLGALRGAEPDWTLTVIAPADGPLLSRCRAMGVEATVLPYPRALAALGEPGAGADHGQVALRVRGLFRLALAAAAAWPYLRRLRAELRRRGATIVHSNGIKAHIVASLARPAGARLVWHLHEYVRPRLATARLLRMFAERPAVIVVNSDSVGADARAVLGADVVLRRVYNAVDLATFTPDGPALDLAAHAGLPADSGSIRIGLIATFGRWKGHDVFLRAVAALAAERSGTPIRAYVIGGAVYQTAGSQHSLEDLRRLAGDLGLNGVVGFTGHLDDMPAALRGLDIVVHASTSAEPFGMVIVEAMAAGRAVVAVDAGGASEIFEDEVDALGHRMGDAAALARQLRRLAEHPTLRASLGRAARRTAERRFAAAEMAAQFRRVYAG